MEAELDNHLQEEVPCTREPKGVFEGFDESQEALLKSRKQPTPRLEEPDKWRKVYMILFPHVEVLDVPSPCKFLTFRCEHWNTDGGI